MSTDQSNGSKEIDITGYMVAFAAILVGVLVIKTSSSFLSVKPSTSSRASEPKNIRGANPAVSSSFDNNAPVSSNKFIYSQISCGKNQIQYFTACIDTSDVRCVASNEKCTNQMVNGEVEDASKWFSPDNKGFTSSLKCKKDQKVCISKTAVDRLFSTSAPEDSNCKKITNADNAKCLFSSLSSNYSLYRFEQEDNEVNTNDIYVQHEGFLGKKYSVKCPETFQIAGLNSPISLGKCYVPKAK